MTDRELLELAAKADGMNLGRYADGWSWSNDGPRGAGVYKIDPNQSPVGNPRFKFLFWNPLTDDGDALRLAVKLGLTVCNEHESAGAVYCTRAETEEFPTVRSGNIGDPPGITEADYASTRRAIVLAAAEIGKTRSD